MEYEIDTELRQQTEPVRTCQNVNATDLEPAVFTQRPGETRLGQKGLQIPEEEVTSPA